MDWRRRATMQANIALMEMASSARWNPLRGYVQISMIDGADANRLYTVDADSLESLLSWMDHVYVLEWTNVAVDAGNPFTLPDQLEIDASIRHVLRPHLRHVVRMGWSLRDSSIGDVAARPD